MFVCQTATAVPELEALLVLSEVVHRQSIIRKPLTVVYIKEKGRYILVLAPLLTFTVTVAASLNHSAVGCLSNHILSHKRLLTPQNWTASPNSFGADNAFSSCHSRGCFLFADSWISVSDLSCYLASVDRWNCCVRLFSPSLRELVQTSQGDLLLCKAVCFLLKTQLWNALLVLCLYAICLFVASIV